VYKGLALQSKLKSMYNYDTAVQAMADLNKRGYNIDFNLDENEDCLTATTLSKETLSLSPEDFEIDEFYRFEGDSDPGDEMVVYAISSAKHNIKGVLVNAFGPYSNSEASAVIKKLSAHHAANNMTGK